MAADCGEFWRDGPVDAPVAVEWDDLEFTLAKRPTGWLLGRIAARDWMALLTALEPPEPLLARIYGTDTDVDLMDAYLLARGVFSALAGVPWWAAVHLAQAAVGNWVLFDGWCAARGADPLKLPLRRTLALMYQLMREGCQDKEAFAELEARVFQPPPEEFTARIDPAVAAIEAQSFLAAIRSGEQTSTP